MSCQQIAMRRLLNQKYEEYVPNLNPFCNILFCENWTWPQLHLPQTLGTKTKPIQAKAITVKPQIVNWFLALSHDEKCAVSMIKNPNFLYNFLKIFHDWNPLLLYHIYQHRKIPNYLSKNRELQSTKDILSYMCIAWLDEPVAYFNADTVQSDSFFQNFINWMDKVSNNKVFQYAHKTKNKSDPQENLLWFTEKSYQSLQAWIVNQFQKVIIKNYYNKNNYNCENHAKVKKLQSGLTETWNSAFGCKKQMENLLCFKIIDTKNKTETDYKDYIQKIKNYQDQYYERTALLLQYEKQQQKLDKNEQSPNKKKKKSKKRNKKKQIQQQNSHEQTLQNNIPKCHSQEKQNVQKQQTQEKLVQQLNNQQKIVIFEQEKKIQKIEINQQNQVLFQNKMQLVQQNNVQKSEQNKKINLVENQVKQFEKSQSGNSGNSQDWSNVETTKTSKKSGQSHPQFNQFSKKDQLKTKRSLSPEQKPKSISKLNRKRKNKGNHISSWNGDESLNENFVQSNECQQCQQYSNKQEAYQKQTSEQIDEKKREQSEINQQIQKKKKKKPSKTMSLIKQLSKKVGASLLSRQLNNFIDSLSIQTNNLYDHKIISFQRIRFFIQSLFPTSQAILFGSNAVGLSLPTSDIDIMLFNLPCSCREEAIEILAHLAVQINTMGWIVSCSTYLNAKVPLVKLQIDPTVEYIKTKRKCDYILARMLDPRIIQHLQLKNKKEPNKNSEQQKQSTSPIIKVDLTINITEQGILGGQSTQLMKQWMNRYPQIHMCILAFKYILAQRGFSSNFKGGIGSYCLFVMVSAYIRQYPQLQQLDDGEFFLSALRFYGQDFENQIKSIILRPLEDPLSTHPYNTCFISLQQTINQIRNNFSFQYQSQDPSLLYNIQSNPLRIFDPINNRIMSGSCQLYPQIKSQFRRIYKQFQQMREIVEKEIEVTVNGAEVGKMLQNKKMMDKWLNKYEGRNRVNVKDILNGGF